MEAIPENHSVGFRSADTAPSKPSAPTDQAGATGYLEEQLTEMLIRISGASPAQITPEARLIEDIGIDSLGFYEILIEADECLGIKIREEDLLQFRTVGDIQHHLQKLTSSDVQAI